MNSENDSNVKQEETHCDEVMVQDESPLDPFGSETEQESEQESQDNEIEENRDEEDSHSEENEPYQLIDNKLSDLVTELASIKAIIEKRLSYDKTKEEAFERLYAELEGFKRDSTFEYMRPFYLDLILFFDRIENIQQSMQELNPINKKLSKLLQNLNDEFLENQKISNALSTLQNELPGNKKFLHILKTLSEELVEILYRRDVEIIRTDSSVFDPTVQKAIGTEITEVETENKHIAKVVRKGFKFRERILRPEEVIVKKYKKPDISNKG